MPRSKPKEIEHAQADIIEDDTPIEEVQFDDVDAVTPLDCHKSVEEQKLRAILAVTVVTMGLIVVAALVAILL
jgi:hypothetical protein